MTLEEWKALFTSGVCPLCGGKLRDTETTVVYVEILLKECVSCGFTFRPEIVSDYPDFAFNTAEAFQRIVGRHLKELRDTIEAGKRAEAKLERIKQEFQSAKPI